MTGMFSTPCCQTCEHISATGPIEHRTYACLLHGCLLPERSAAKQGFLICQMFGYHDRPGSPIPSAQIARFPDPGMLYAFQSEYAPDPVLEVAKFEDLPPIGK